MSMITAASWVPRGFAAPFPQKYTLDEEEFARIAELAKLQLDDAEEDLKEAQEGEDGAKQAGKQDDDEEMKDDGEKSHKKFVICTETIDEIANTKQGTLLTTTTSRNTT